MRSFLRNAAVGAVVIVLLLLLPLMAAVALIVYAFVRLYRWALRLAFRLRHPGKDLLLVYSNSPNWQQYVEAEWFPRWGSRAVVLNWSERHNWLRSGRIEAMLFRTYAGETEFNPLAVVVRRGPFSPVIVRFFKPFRGFKYGHPHKLQDAEHKLQVALDQNARRSR